jgi:hypothetical protein
MSGCAPDQAEVAECAPDSSNHSEACHDIMITFITMDKAIKTGKIVENYF